MSMLPEDIFTILFSGIMGLLGGLLSIPIHAMISSVLKRDDLWYQNRLDKIERQRELLLQHQLEIMRVDFEQNELAVLKERLSRIEKGNRHA